MPKKTPGRLNRPPNSNDFDKIPLKALCRTLSGTSYRLHSVDLATGSPRPPIHFSSKGNSRFDPSGGVGTLYVANTLAGALMEIFDDRWGAVGTLGRTLTRHEMKQWWVTRVNLPEVELFDATGANLSKLGTDAQLTTGQYTITREWALRLMTHPATIDGIYYSSRHDLQQRNIALFQRPRFLPVWFDITLNTSGPNDWNRTIALGDKLVHGPASLLENHPELFDLLRDLEVAVLP
jgi:hypothetical protein